MKSLELKIPPPVVALTLAALMWLVTVMFPVADLSIPGSAIASGVIALVGFVIALIGVLQFWRAETTINPHIPHKTAHLVDTGIYRLSRNPMYLGMLLVLLALGIYLGNILTLLALPAFVLYVNRFQILPEERQMRKHFGPAFETYAAKVRRWV